MSKPRGKSGNKKQKTDAKPETGINILIIKF